MLPIVINFLLAIHVIVALLIILLVLMQRPKNEGLGAAFGGGMTENLFGAQTTNVLQTITRWLGGIFFGLALLLSWLYVKEHSTRSTLEQRLTAPTVIPATPAPLAPQIPPVTLPEAATAPVKPGELPKSSDLNKPAEKLGLPVATPKPATETKLAPEPSKPAEQPKPETPAPASQEKAPEPPKQ